MIDNPYESPTASDDAGQRSALGYSDEYDATRWMLPYAWFATGTWVGVVLSFAVEAVFLPRPPSSDSTQPSVPFMIAAYIPFSFLISLLFLGWGKWRSRMHRKFGTPRRIAWWISTLLGLLFMPLAIGGIGLVMLFDGRSILIGSMVAFSLFVYPFAAAEVAWRSAYREP